VCLDIDDTLSTAGKLTAPAYEALWKLKEAGFFVVPITGRPAGWCDHIVRFWPVDAVVGENGAFTFFLRSGGRGRLDTPGALADPRERERQRDALAQAVLRRFPKARWASDQAYREHDLAIDIREDVPPWSEAEVEELLSLCAAQGAHAKLSSIHVNAWWGDYDKFSGFGHWRDRGFPGLAGPGGEPPANLSELQRPEAWLFIGDSPNDEPLFKQFKQSVGVANLGRFLGKMQDLPRWITSGESGAGFAQMASRLASLGPVAVGLG
jgi:hypothetical protein